jgi:hypothetical protein
MLPRALWVTALATVLLAIAALAVIVALKPVTAIPTPDAAAPAPRWAPAAAAPVANPSPTMPGVSGLVDAEWLAATAERTGIPARALAAYAGVAIAKAAAMPSCGLSWNTLAGIGFAESRHGTHGGSSILPDGTTSPAIIGIALDGGSSANIPDSDGGTYDGDSEFDRAIGPMQLIPQTWRNWHTDASGDGIEDPQNIDDAVQATANYLCRASGDMTTEQGWRAGIAAYNSAGSYLTAVATAAVQYGDD